MSRGAPRFSSRQVALQALYAVDLATSRSGNGGSAAGDGAPAASVPLEDAFETVAESFGLPEAARAFAKELVFGVLERREELDALISRHARNWRVSRMAAVDRNVLRLASWELAHTDTPTGVVLDQAIELARRFGDEPSPAFVNGVLDAIARSIERPPGAPA